MTKLNYLTEHAEPLQQPKETEMKIFLKAQRFSGIAQAKKAEADAKLSFAQAEKLFAEAEKERESMKIERIKLANQIIDKYNPELSGPERIDFVMRLLGDINRLLESNLDIVKVT